MLRFFRLAALVLLMTSWEVAGTLTIRKPRPRTSGVTRTWTRFALNLAIQHKHVITWATRLHPGKRDYACHDNKHPHCCDKGRYQSIDHGAAIVLTGPIPYCTGDGQ
ncbi:hypothetical protein H4Q26_016214 [Puccinia striiformis f. sp. tritici PST-130]|nr:hypothetical protein H4Q26_016214 [Puccinia striiformis f. sp. tritici PST-130]